MKPINHTAPVATELSYPETTEGTKIAAAVRAKANKWTDAKRQDLFQRGMQIIYGGSGNCTSKIQR